MMKSRSIRTAIGFIAGVSLIATSLSGQTLARPGWVGSGLSAQTWFKHAILYEIDTRTFSDSNGDGVGDLKGVTQRLDYIHSLGVDAIVFRPLTAAAAGTGFSIPIDPLLGSLEDFDELTLQASRLKIRILLELPHPDAALARFWLTRGVAGFYLSGNQQANAAATQTIRALVPTYVGQRVLITDADLAAANVARPSPSELLLDRVLLKASNSAPELRASLEQSQSLLRIGTPILAADNAGIADADPRLAKIFATFVLLNRSASLISAGQELGFSTGSGKAALMPWGQSAAAPVEEGAEAAKPPPAPVVAAPDKYAPYVPYVRPTAPKKAAPPDPTTAAGQESNPNSLLNFYRELGRLHHGSTALRDGEEITFNHDDRNALIWIRKPASPSQFNPPVLIACNLSDKPLVISLKADVARLQLRGSFLRTILRSDDLMGGTSLDPITLPAFGVYVGGLRY